MIAKLQEFADWPAFKIKLGTPDDLAIVRALRGTHDGAATGRCQLQLDRRRDPGQGRRI